jgi:hypothetical protein
MTLISPRGAAGVDKASAIPTKTAQQGGGADNVIRKRQAGHARGTEANARLVVAKFTLAKTLSILHQIRLEFSEGFEMRGNDLHADRAVMTIDHMAEKSLHSQDQTVSSSITPSIIDGVIVLERRY